MGELILCKQHLAANPFYIEEISLNIYSIEELSYYISNNIYLLSEEFMSKDLIGWIGDELAMPELKAQLMEMYVTKEKLSVFVDAILSSSGYLTLQERKSIMEEISSFENKSPVQAAKMRADRLFDRKRYVACIYEYSDMIDSGNLMRETSEFEGSVWHNLGAAYANLFFFKNALDCFEKAYSTNHSDASLKSLITTAVIYDDFGGHNELNRYISRFALDASIIGEIKGEIYDVTRNNKFDAKIFFDEDEMHSIDSIGADLDSDQKAIIEELKTTYSRLCNF